MNKNKLLFFVFIVTIIAILALIFKVSSKDETQTTNNNAQSKEEKRGLTDVEKDNYVNTIRTLSQRNLQYENRIAALENNKNSSENSDVMVEDLIQRKVDEKSKSQFEAYKKEFASMLDNIPVMNRLSDKDEPPQKYSKPPGYANKKEEIPSGLGFDSLLNPGSSINQSTNNKVQADELPISPNENLVTITPFTRVAYSNDDRNPVPVSITGEPLVKKEIDKKTKSTIEEQNPSIPFYTIPRNSTLFSNTTLTALLGIVPDVEGSVLDPIRFKLITGPQNLASNGHFIDGVRDIVWSGIAIGNRELSCVRGEVHSVTFTFNDGTVYTQSSTDSGKSTTTNVRKILGYISDTRGKPCIQGTLITNAKDYLTDRIIASGVGSTAEAYGDTQTTTTTSINGTTQSFTGDEESYIAAATLTGSLSELTAYLRERQRNAVDLVYLDSGEDVVLHIEDEITIDYFLKGRKLNYANQIPELQSKASYQLD